MLMYDRHQIKKEPKLPLSHELNVYYTYAHTEHHKTQAIRAIKIDSCDVIVMCCKEIKIYWG